MKKLALVAILGVLVFLTPGIQAQYTTQGNTTLSVAINPEAALNITDGTTALATTGTNFNNPYTGTTNLTYKIRTKQTGGSGSITLQVTTDFGAGGPSVASPLTGDTITYTCTVSAPGTGCTGSLTPTTTGTTSVATFGTDAHSAQGNGSSNSASVTWSIPNDPAYKTGTYTATVQFTIAAL